LQIEQKNLVPAQEAPNNCYGTGTQKQTSVSQLGYSYLLYFCVVGDWWVLIDTFI
jgi:hypothetical protein